MKKWMKKPITLIAIAVILGLAGVLAEYVVFAQRSIETERIEGNGGQRGQILNATSEQLEDLLADDMNALYHFAGALNNGEMDPNKATVVQCTNVDEQVKSVVEVQLFDYDSLDVYTASYSLLPLRTVTFESIPVAFTFADVFINAGRVDQGYGIIRTEHGNVICTVQTIDPDNLPPTWSFDIPLYTGPFYPSFVPLIQNRSAP